RSGPAHHSLNFIPMPTGDTLALFNPTGRLTSLVDTLQDQPPLTSYTTFTDNTPVNTPDWILGDWNGDGQQTPGVYSNGAFYFTNDVGSSAAWSYIWIGQVDVDVVSGRFDPSVAHECLGVVLRGYAIGFPLVWTCDFTAGTAPTLHHHWIGLPLELPEVN